VGGCLAMIIISSSQVEMWDVFEITLMCSKNLKINPFVDVYVKAKFTNKETGNTKEIVGFYDGDNKWKIRFMPEELGEYYFKINSNIKEFDGKEGEFESIEPSENNHGPVRVANKYHFSYADGTPFFVMGTTAYAWTYMPEEIRAKTLKSFEQYGFNKIRMLVFPKYYTGQRSNLDVSYEPPVWPFEGEPLNFDFRKPNPKYYQNFENCIYELMKRNIQADVILFHPYDKWGISEKMSIDDMLIYIKYVVARFSAFRNVWWSLANEYNLLPFSLDTWDLIGSYLHAIDPYKHLISIHNLPMAPVYPNREWLTHISYQHPNTYSLMIELKKLYGKPVIDDEYQYEGNIEDDWGNSSAELVVMRHWLSVMAGGYATHGEVYKKGENNKDLFWSYGGELVGESPKRLKFLKEIVESCPFQELEIDWANTDGHNTFSLSKGYDFYLMFFRYNLPGKYPWIGRWDMEEKYEATYYDIWNCKMVGKEIVKSGIFTGDRMKITEWTVVKLQKLSK